MYLKLKFFFVLCGSVIVNGYIELTPRDDALDQELYESVLDPELCQKQLAYIVNNTLLMTSFLDSGIRTPRGILKGNLVDLGNYYQCLEINHDSGDSIIQGKYCSIRVPLQQRSMHSHIEDFGLSEFPWTELFSVTSPLTGDIVERIKEYERIRSGVEMFRGLPDRYSRVSSENPLASVAMTLAVCIPQSCTTGQALETLMPFTSTIGMEFSDNYCRLPNDKPWVSVDYVAAAVFGTIGILTLLSTAYDLCHSVILKRDPKAANPLYTSFSIVTNTRRLVTVTPTNNSIDCLDGLRVFAITWVVLGHVYSNQLANPLANPVDILDWLKQFYSILVTAAPITVDTFFFLSGMLVVYTTVGKYGRIKFIQNLHMFYLHRLLRMFPLLAAGVLLQASWFNHIADGPYWQPFIGHINTCRAYWWSTLLYLQNYLHPGICLSHTWYLAVDMQAYFLSPIIIFWVMGSRRSAWTALALGLAASLVAATTFNAIWEFPSNAINADTMAGTANNSDYLTQYYTNTLTRISPYIVGMVFGYLLLVGKQTKIRLNKSLAAFLWIVWLVITLGVVGITYPMQQASWDSVNMDIIINSFMRPLWAATLGWMIFACANGYGGPINWVLSLSVWKVPARLSYGVYIFHYPVQLALNSTILAPLYFRDDVFLFRFFGDISLSFFVAFLAGVLIDAPFSTLIKMMFGGGFKKQKTQRQPNSKSSINGVVSTTFSEHEGKTKL